MSTDFARHPRAGTTYNGLVKALERQTAAVLPPLKTDLRRQAQCWLTGLLWDWRIDRSRGSEKAHLIRTCLLRGCASNPSKGRAALQRALVSELKDTYSPP